MKPEDEARRIATKFTVLANEAEITLEGCIAAALCAARVAGIEEAADVVSRDFTPARDCSMHCAGGCSACCPGTVLDEIERAIRALLPPAEPAAAKCETCWGFERVCRCHGEPPHATRMGLIPCPSCAKEPR